MLETLGENLHKTIQGYIESLDKIEKVNDQIYQERLGYCEQCDSMQNGVCKYCGCFVIIKACKKNQKCPYPKSPRW